MQPEGAYPAFIFKIYIITSKGHAHKLASFFFSPNHQQVLYHPAPVLSHRLATIFIIFIHIHQGVVCGGPVSSFLVLSHLLVDKEQQQFLFCFLFIPKHILLSVCFILKETSFTQSFTNIITCLMSVCHSWCTFPPSLAEH
eukprot:720463_1